MVFLNVFHYHDPLWNQRSHDHDDAPISNAAEWALKSAYMVSSAWFEMDSLQSRFEATSKYEIRAVGLVLSKTDSRLSVV